MKVLKKSTKNKEAVRLQIPSEKSYLSVFRLVLKSILKKNNADKDAIDDVELASSEFLARAIEVKVVNEQIFIEILCTENRLDLTFKGLKNFNINDLFSSPYLNFKLIKGLLDDINILSLSNQEIAVKLVKNF